MYREIGEISDDQLFSVMGVDSMRATRIMASLSQLAGKRFSPALMWAYPTIRALSDRIVDGDAEEGTEKTDSTTLRAVRRNVRVGEPIAVVGIYCHFPRANSLKSFWDLLDAGSDAVSNVPVDRWNADSLFHTDPDVLGDLKAAQSGFLDGRIDSVKTNVGHLEAAAGIAGLIPGGPQDEQRVDRGTTSQPMITHSLAGVRDTNEVTYLPGYSRQRRFPVGQSRYQWRPGGPCLTRSLAGLRPVRGVVVSAAARRLRPPETERNAMSVSTDRAEVGPGYRAGILNHDLSTELDWLRLLEAALDPASRATLSARGIPPAARVLGPARRAGPGGDSRTPTSRTSARA